LITNDIGEVAIAYYQPSQVLVEGTRTPTGRDYVFVTRRQGVCMAWVHPDDVPALLAIKRHCCGGKYRPKFAPATEAQVSLWEGGDGRGGDGGSGPCGYC